MHTFAYHRPANAKQAATLLAKKETKALAGGQTLIPSLKLRLASVDNLVDLGTTPEHGYRVEVNKAVVDDDLTIYLNCSTFRGFQGGWKSICVGLSTYRSISLWR